MEAEKMATPQKKGARGLVAKFFKRPDQGAANIMADVNALTEHDQIQLASAIARQENIPVGDLAFTPVEY